MATVTARRRRSIEGVVATDYARDRVARAVFEVVADALDLGPIAVRSAADRAWVRTAIAGPIQHAADQALDRLVDELIDQLSTGRSDLVVRILRASAEPWPDVKPRAMPLTPMPADREVDSNRLRVAVLR
jgi:predicted NBD/HSP70 family sugar kinase